MMSLMMAAVTTCAVTTAAATGAVVTGPRPTDSAAIAVSPRGARMVAAGTAESMHPTAMA